MIIVKNISKSFISGEETVKALDNVTFEIGDGKFVAIVGKSGSGKTSLLSLLGALDLPDDGEIIVDERNIVKMNPKELTKYRTKSIGFVFQSYNLVPNLTAIENVALPMEFNGLSKDQRISRAKELLLEVDITEEQFYRKPTKLSGGQQQRVAIARALANSPKYILADEPTGNLDSDTGHKIITLLKKLAKIDKTTIIIVTHDQEIAVKADFNIKIKDGRIVK